MNIPNKIYLQICPEHGMDCNKEIYWCEDQTNDTDVEYQIVRLPTTVASDLACSHAQTYATTGGNFCVKCGAFVITPSA